MNTRLYSLIATCKANGVNPERYLADALLRIQHPPQSQLEELLPANWARARAREAQATQLNTG